MDELTTGQMSMIATTLNEILNELRKGEQWAGSGRARQQQEGGSVTPVVASTSDTKLLSRNAFRQEAIVYNNSTATLYVKYGRDSSATSFTFLVLAGQALVVDHYTGPLYGTWDAANGNAMVTEV
jgi:hypothetical protein